MRRSVRSIQGRFPSTNGSTSASARPAGTTTSTPSGATLMRARWPGENDGLVYGLCQPAQD